MLRHPLGQWGRPDWKGAAWRTSLQELCGLCPSGTRCLGAQGSGLPVFWPLQQIGVFLRTLVQCLPPIL